MPGGVNSPARAFGGVGGEPIFIDRAAGAWLYDLDGNLIEVGEAMDAVARRLAADGRTADEVAALTQPDEVYWVTGTTEEIDRLIER